MPSNLPQLVSFYCQPYQQKSVPAVYPQFSSKIAPKITISQYLDRLFSYFKCSDECYYVALIYIQRLAQFVEINQFNIHRILLTSLMLAAKFFDDIFYSNAYYAQVGGISNSELNQLEAQFLETIKYKLLVSGEEFENQKLQLLKLEEMNFFSEQIQID